MQWFPWQHRSDRTSCAMVSWEEAEKLDYRALAKAGGRRGNLLYIRTFLYLLKILYKFVSIFFYLELLKHFEYKGSSVAQPHPPSVDWFAHATPPPPDQHTTPYTSKLTASWMTWDTDNPPSVKLPSISNAKEQGVLAIQQKQDGTKLPQV